MRALTLIAFTALGCTAAVCAQTPDEERDSLRGLAGVMILIERLPAEAEAIELTREDLEREVLYRFQRAEIPILDATARSENERQPYLYVNCNVLYVPDLQLVSFSIDVELHQAAVLKNGDELPALTWARSYLGIQHRDRAASVIRTQLGEFIERFISDYHSVNAAIKDGADN